MLLETREDGTFRVGDTFRIQVKTSSDAYLQVIDIGTDGTLPDASGNSEEWKVGGPVGREWILAFATSEPVKVHAALMTPAGAEEAGRVARLHGGLTGPSRGSAPSRGSE